jgi:hypothetical protein
VWWESSRHVDSSVASPPPDSPVKRFTP